MLGYHKWKLIRTNFFIDTMIGHAIIYLFIGAILFKLTTMCIEGAYDVKWTLDELKKMKEKTQSLDQESQYAY